MTVECRICGVNLKEQDHPLARPVSWPPMWDFGEFTIERGFSNMPTKDEMCRKCSVAAGTTQQEG